MHGFDRLGAIKSHETVLIQGSGPFGNFATAVAKDHGAKKVLVIGAPANRLEVTRRMGADAVLNLEEVTDEKQRRQWVNDHTDGRGADVVIQVANNMAVPEGLTLLRDGGRYLNIGAGGKANIAVEKIPQEMLFITVVPANRATGFRPSIFSLRAEDVSLRRDDQQELQARSDQRSHGSDGELLGGQSGD